MSADAQAATALIAKDEIRELVHTYSRAVDRKDAVLLRSLYTKDGRDDHGPGYNGTADELIAALLQIWPHIPASGHYMCNHLISVDGDRAEGEVYAIAYHLMPDDTGRTVEDLMGVRYLDEYRKEDGRWRFANRVLVIDWRTMTPTADKAGSEPSADLSYATLRHRLFERAAP